MDDQWISKWLPLKLLQLEWEIELDAYQKAQWVNVEGMYFLISRKKNKKQQFHENFKKPCYFSFIDRLEVEYKNPDVEVHVVELVGVEAAEDVVRKSTNLNNR